MSGTRDGHDTLELRDDEKFRELAEHADVVFALRDIRSGVLLYANPAYEAIWGRPLDELSQDESSWLDAIHPEDRPQVEAALPARSSSKWESRYRIIRPDGSIRHIRHTTVAVRDDAGLPVRLASVATDVTELVRSMEALSESEERLRQIAEHLNVGVWIYTADFSQTLYASSVAARLWGGSVQGAYERPLAFLDRVHADDRSILIDAIATRTEGEFLVRTLPELGSRHLLIRAFPVRDASGQAFRIVGITEDVTDRIATERALHESEEKYRRLVETSPNAIYALDDAGRFTEANSATQRLVGRTAADLFGRHYHDVLHPEDIEKADSAFSNLLSGEESVLTTELRVLGPDGTTRLLSLTIAVIRDGNASGVHGIGRDITDERLREQHLRRAERFASLGTLTSGVAHELNNPLQAISGFADFLLSGEHLPGQKEALEIIAHEAQRASRIVSELRTIARNSHNERAERAPVDLNTVVRNVIRSRRYAMTTADVEMVTDLQDELPLIDGDQAVLEQAIVNLVVNAEQALATVPTPRRLILRTLSDAHNVCVTVDDNGPGISAAHMPRLFDPFWTTKAPGEGTGLGLAMVQSVMEEHGATIAVNSTPRVSTAFTITFPRCAREHAAVDGGDVDSVSVVAGPRRILVVDDEPAVRRLIVRVGSRDGHAMDEAENGTDALERVREAHEEGRPYDLVISDLRMPGMPGDAMLYRLVEEFPEYREKRVMLTGDPTAGAVDTLVEDGVTVVQKPLAIEHLREIMTRE